MNELDVLVREGIRRVSALPGGAPQREGFVLPNEEGRGIDDGGLTDFTTREDTPSDSNGMLGVGVAEAINVDSLIVDSRAHPVEYADQEM